MKLLLKIVGVIILIIVVVAIAAFEFYWHRNMHWYRLCVRKQGNENGIKGFYHTSDRVLFLYQKTVK